MIIRGIFLFLCICLSGCAMRHPMGLTSEQWNALTPEKQAEVQAQQYAIDAAKRQQQEAERIERDRMAYEAFMARNERIRQAYANAKYGDIVTVVIQDGAIGQGGRPHRYEPLSFDLIKGEIKAIEFHGADVRAVLDRGTARLSEDGNMVYIDEETRDRVVLANSDWEHGQAYMPSAAHGGKYASRHGITYRIKYKQLPGAPARVIIETEAKPGELSTLGRK